MASSVLSPACATVGLRRAGALRPSRTIRARVQPVVTSAASSVPTTWSLSSYDEVVEEKYKCEILGQCNIGMGSSTPVEQIMSTELTTTTCKATLAEVEELFAQRPISGMPVLKDGVLVGVISRKDLRGTYDQGNLVQASPGTCTRRSLPAGAAAVATMLWIDVMSEPAIYIQPTNTIMEAAMLMLMYKIHRVPVVDSEKHVIGMVTRTDIFNSLGIFGPAP
ncbi:hypothetical protein N2152v2_010765 [Parachlorella kessleri]